GLARRIAGARQPRYPSRSRGRRRPALCARRGGARVTRPPAVAVIAEELCIGCTLCIQACPVDAIVGAARLMHTVIARDCIGCELCVPPCPVDCISMVETGAQPARAERRLVAEGARQRFELRK